MKINPKYSSIIDEIANFKAGYWIYNQYDGNSRIGNWHCSECGQIIFVPYHACNYNYCPNCGAKMESEE